MQVIAVRQFVNAEGSWTSIVGGKMISQMAEIVFVYYLPCWR